METNPSDQPTQKSLKRLIPSFALSSFQITLITFILILCGMIGFAYVMKDKTEQKLAEKGPMAIITISNEVINRDQSPDNKIETAEEMSEDPTLKEDLSNDSTKSPLPSSPMPGVYEDSADGYLPAISKDGSKPYVVYAKPSKSYPNIPKISIILTEIGFNSAINETIISTMSNRITLSVSPYVENLNQLTNTFRQSGFEFLIELPVESMHFPKDDSGPYALLSHLEPSMNLKRLKWNMTRTTGYIGFVTFKDSRLMSISTLIEPVLDEIQNRGLLFASITDGKEEDNIDVLADKISLPFIPITSEIDTVLSEEFINSSLKELELHSLKNGHVVAYAHSSPLTLKLLSNWINTLESKGIALVPASAYDIEKMNKEKQTQSAETTDKQEDTSK
jgi:polysaccharide deacetylase 2 family uncharacterized protein YibQ